MLVFGFNTPYARLSFLLCEIGIRVPKEFTPLSLQSIKGCAEVSNAFTHLQKPFASIALLLFFHKAELFELGAGSRQFVSHRLFFLEVVEACRQALQYAGELLHLMQDMPKACELKAQAVKLGFKLDEFRFKLKVEAAYFSFKDSFFLLKALDAIQSLLSIVPDLFELGAQALQAFLPL